MRTLTGEQAKQKLHKQGSSLKAFAQSNNFCYATVSAVVSGRLKASYGKTYAIALALGMRSETAQ